MSVAGRNLAGRIAATTSGLTGSWPAAMNHSCSTVAQPANLPLASRDAGQTDSSAAGRTMGEPTAWSALEDVTLPGAEWEGVSVKLRYYTGIRWDLPCSCGLVCPDAPSSVPGIRCCGTSIAHCTWAAEANPLPPAPTNPEKDLAYILGLYPKHGTPAKTADDHSCPGPCICDLVST